jgi:hypothetical protein
VLPHSSNTVVVFVLRVSRLHLCKC